MTPPKYGLKLVVGLASLLWTVLALWLLPWSSAYFAAAILVWVALLIAYPLASLLLLPTLIPSVDLTPWVGWALVNEVDVILPATLAAVCIGSAFRHPANRDPIAVTGREYLIIGAFCSLWIASFFTSSELGNVQLLPRQVFYFTTEYRLSLLKGPVYGLLLMTIWHVLRTNYGPRAVDGLFYGMALAAFTLFVIVGWERGVWSTLFSSGPYYHRLSALLDFTSTYRITGLLAGMHAGGESIDGLLVLLLGFNLAGWVCATGWRQALHAAASAVLMYCIIVTFTRTTYMVMAAMAALALLIAWMIHRNVRSRSAADSSINDPFEPPVQVSRGHSVLLGAVAVNIVVALVVAYRVGGYIGVVAVFTVVAISVGMLLLPQRISAMVWLAPSAYACAILIAVYGAITSKWHDPDAIQLAALVAALLVLSALTHLTAKYVAVPRKQLIQATGIVFLIGSFLVVVLGSYRMSARMENVEADLKGRFGHWSHVLESSKADLTTHLFGNGPGAFPLRYALTYPQYVKPVGSFVLTDDGLRLGVGDDLKLAQRLPITGDNPYMVKVNLDASGKGNLMVALCERNQLIQVNFYPSCVWKRVAVAKGEQQVTVELNSQHVGRRPWYSRWPTSIHLWNDMYSPPITLQQVTLSEADSNTNLLRNSAFNSLSDWYFYNDFQHLAWHIKNIPFAVFYEFGVLGCVLYVWLIGAVLKRLFGQLATGDALACAGTLVITGIVGVGMLGNPLDDTRISMLFFGILFLLLTDHRPANLAPADIRRENQISAIDPVG